MPMPKTSECQSNHSDVTELKILDNDLVAYSTKDHGLKIISSEDCSIKLSIDKVHELFSNSYSSSFSPNGEFLAFCVKTQIYIIHIASRIVIKIINCDNEDIEIVSFDLESKYIIAGTACGRVLLYRYDGSSLLGRLCSFKKINQKDDLTQSFISAIAFYKNRLACASHNGDIFIIDIHSRLGRTSFANSFIRVNTLCFLDETTIISGNANGTLFINYIEDEKKSKQVKTGFKTISAIIRMPNPNYIMISGNVNYVSLYDIKNNKIVHHKYLEFKGKVTKIGLTDNTLIAVVDNLTLYHVQLPSVAKLKSFILHNKLDAAFHLCEQDCMITESLEYKKLQDSYNKIYEQAIELLINQQKTEALKLLDIFKNIPSKKDEIALLFKSFEHYPRLQELFLEKKYALAYALCAKFPALESTSQYKKMEELWREAFINAQKQILLGRDEIAKSLLLEYVTILSKRPMIRLILNHNKEFIEFLKVVEAKNFLKVNEIVKTNEAFTKIPTYKLLENDIECGLLEIKDFIKIGNTNAAKENILKFEGLPSVAIEIAKLTQEYQNMQKLLKAYKDGNLIACYEILDEHISLSFTELGESLQMKWSELIHTCEEYALRGNIKDIKVTLGGLINLSTRRDKIGDLLRVSFHTKIKILMTKKSFKNAENIIYSYIDIFGTDMEINSLIRLYETVTNTRLAVSHNSRQTRDNWINFEMIMNS